MILMTNEGQRTPKKTILIASVIFVLVIGSGLIYWLTQPQEEPLEVYMDISPFELESVSDGTYDSDNDKVKLISFILVDCPDGVCPATMLDFADLQDELKDEGLFGEQVELLSITVDPLRDDTERLKDYAQGFGADFEGWQFLRGSEEEIAQVADDLAYGYSVTEEGLEYHMTHMYLVDEEHQVRAIPTMSSPNEPMDMEQILNDIEQLTD